MSLIGLLLRGFGGTVDTGGGGTPIPGPAVAGLDHSPSDIVRHLLCEIGIGDLPSDNPSEWAIFESMENDQPDNCITVYCTSGILMGRIQDNGLYKEQYGLQFRVRANSTVEAYRKINEISATIDTVVLENTITIDSSIYTIISINRKGGILSLGKESPTTKRSIYTLNAVASIQMHSSS